MTNETNYKTLYDLLADKEFGSEVKKLYIIKKYDRKVKALFIKDMNGDEGCEEGTKLFVSVEGDLFHFKDSEVEIAKAPITKARVETKIIDIDNNQGEMESEEDFENREEQIFINIEKLTKLWRYNSPDDLRLQGAELKKYLIEIFKIK